MTGVLIRQIHTCTCTHRHACMHTRTHTGDRHVKIDAAAVYQGRPRVAGSHQKLEETKKGFFPGALEGVQP